MRASPTAVQAVAVNTVGWLAAPGTVIAVPVYQRHYRWSIDDCGRLLDDIRKVAGDGHPAHFLGSVLATVSTVGGVEELVLVDGQQRITTLTLLIAALERAFRNPDPVLADQLNRALVHPTDPVRTRLLPHKSSVAVFESLIFDRPATREELDASSLDENFAFFVREVSRDPNTVWRGLQRVEHIAITLGPDTDPQQVFESVNSTGAPLRNHELIHNHVLMGLTHDQQTEIEETYWIPIEQSTGDAIDDFWRDYLILLRGRDADLVGDHAIYRIFRTTFTGLDVDTLKSRAHEWKQFAESYGRMLDPALESDDEIRRHLSYVNTFGRAMYPLVMAVYRDYEDGTRLDKATLIATLQQMQTLYLRKMLVGESRDHLAAQLCRTLPDSPGLVRNIARRCPSDERIRSALAYRPLPHAGYVLARLNGPLSSEELEERLGAELEIEHILPVFPRPDWVGFEGGVMWVRMDQGQLARHRELLQTLGNLTLLEQPLNAGAGNLSFPQKLPYYRRSGVAMVHYLTNLESWDPAAMEGRGTRLTQEFLEVWSVPTPTDPEHLGLTPILDIPERFGFWPGWKTEYEYVRFGDEIWEVRNVGELYVRIFARLWQTHHTAVIAWNREVRGPIQQTKDGASRFTPLGDDHFLVSSQQPRFKLADIQRVLEALNLADEVAVRFAADPE